ncbi:metallopeptidase family protein [Schaalia sp. Marseille-Q2122]|uniref:metallopeptidase family protein n=1 Tax=Schaalia sp. Marseille-Q2122 TaxID=2736604 RepID=UPI001589FB27|nr:metallopeptidase family protein [Schaalia sp. Marseille-Q2122]
MPIEMSREDFEALVDEAIDVIPDEFWDQVENLVVLVEDEPPASEPSDILGLYDGVPITERDDYAGVLPDRVFVFRNPTLAICDTVDDVAEEIRVTLVHEIGHFFGFDDDQLHDLGWA